MVTLVYSYPMACWKCCITALKTHTGIVIYRIVLYTAFRGYQNEKFKY